MNGDMNYRIDQRREAVIASIRAGELPQLVIHDQLRKEMKFNRAFRLREFCEGALDFAPTYKYDRRSDEYDSSSDESSSDESDTPPPPRKVASIHSRL